MRRLLISILTLFSVAVCAHAYPQLDSNNKQIPIPLKRDKDSGIGNPSKPLSLRNCVEAYYCNGLITVLFNSEIDSADVTVYNYNTGESWSEYTSGSDMLIINLCDNEGYYEIVITTDTDKYTGYFTI